MRGFTDFLNKNLNTVFINKGDYDSFQTFLSKQTFIGDI